MPKKINPNKKWEIAVLSKVEGYNRSRIARETGVSRHCVSETISNYKKSGKKDPCYLPPRQVNKTATTDEQDAQLIALCKEEPFLKPRDLRNRLGMEHVSLTTIKRRLKDAGLHGYRSPSKPSLTEHHKAERLKFCLNHLPPGYDLNSIPNHDGGHRFQDWNNVVFSDESMICSSNNGGIQWVRRPRNARWEDKYLSANTSSERITCSVWGYITREGLGELVRIKGRLNGPKYISDIVRPYVTPFMEEHEDYLFQQDNCPVHCSGYVKSYFEENEVNMLQGWPAKSPDLNLIEHVWHQLKRELEGKMNGIKGGRKKKQDKLWELTQAAWERLRLKEPPIVDALYAGMGKRIKFCIERDGSSTPY